MYINIKINILLCLLPHLLLGGYTLYTGSKFVAAEGRGSGPLIANRDYPSERETFFIFVPQPGGTYTIRVCRSSSLYPSLNLKAGGVSDVDGYARVLVEYLLIFLLFSVTGIFK